MLTVIDPGILSTVQDHGRSGYRAFGMPLSGAMDRYAFTMANILAGNPRNAAVVEMTMRGARFRFSARVYVAICGAEMQAQLDGARIPNWSALYVAPGSELAFRCAVTGCRSYVAFRGGIDVPEIMGSRSTFLRAHLGGYEGRALKSGDVLSIAPSECSRSSRTELPSSLVPAYESDLQLRAMLGPQNDHFTDEGMLTFLNSPYVVSTRHDRMGYLLEGPAIAHGSGPDIVSDALCPGSVQVPGSGMPIIMASDCQTTGGYAKIATVIGPDLPKVAQMKAGDRVRFTICTDREAVAALIAEQACYEDAHRRLSHVID